MIQIKDLIIKYLHVVPGVDKKRVGKGIDRDPFTVVEDLKATELVLGKQGQEAVVCVRG